MKNTALVAFALLAACSSPKEEPPAYRLPPEWEPHEAVWFTYSGTAADTVLDKVVLAMDTATRVVCAADNDSLAATIVMRWDSLGIARTRYRVEVMGEGLYAPAVRDAGPIFLRRRDGSPAVLDPDWNYYGDLENLVGTPAHLLAYEDSFPRMLARRMGLPVVHSDLVIEGGAVEVNGAGVLLQVEAVTMQRNPGWSRDSMEHELKRVLGVRDIIWLKEGPADDMWYLEPRIHGRVFNQGTGGHVDEFCRFVNDSTVLLAWPEDDELADPVHAVARHRMEVNERILQEAGLHVLHAPVPVLEYRGLILDSLKDHHARLLARYPEVQHGDSVRQLHAASYLNLLITNGCVFVPAYWHEGLSEEMRIKDERMRKLLRPLFSGRRIVPIDPRAINRFGGGMHCWTQQQPR
ncbi:MAG: agmatine deiminase family protein [Flavobacteriales bacterium]|nr:agmatine deiminase family protein [Flavobacteriales bacterium]